MNIQTVGIISPGDMGHAIGAVLRQHGMRVITNLRGRSARTVELAKAAGIGDVSEDEILVREADVLLSILPPDRAYKCAERIATAMRKMGAELLFVDCNAIAPRTAQALDQLLTEAGASFVDVGIIGGPPQAGVQGPRLYASGARASDVAGLRAYGLDVRVLGPHSGQASGLKMCYASLTKGLTALATEALVAARALGLQEPLTSEFQALPLFKMIERGVPGMPPKAYRWVGEMEEIARTFADLGLPPQMPEGAASLYRFIELQYPENGSLTTRERQPSPSLFSILEHPNRSRDLALGSETPEQRHHGQTLEEVISILATALAEKNQTSS